VTRLRDSDGHWTSFARDDAGSLQTITAGDGWIALEYDTWRRIVRATDSGGAIVTYAYDDGGRLARVEASDGAVRSYTYNDRGDMLSVDEPHHVVENTFVDSRCVRQVSRLSDDYGRIRSRTIEMTYSAQADGRTTTEVGDSDGFRTIWEFDRDKYQVGATYHDPSGREARAAVERDPATHATLSVTVACLGPAGPIARTAAAAGRDADLVTEELMRRECASR